MGCVSTLVNVVMAIGPIVKGIDRHTNVHFLVFSKTKRTTWCVNKKVIEELDVKIVWTGGTVPNRKRSQDCGLAAGTMSTMDLH